MNARLRRRRDDRLDAVSRTPAARCCPASARCGSSPANGDAFFPAGTTFGPDGQVDAFYLPPINDEFGKTVLGGGTFYAAFQDRPEVQAFL